MISLVDIGECKDLPPQGGLAKATVEVLISGERFSKYEKQSHICHSILSDTPYIAALSWPHLATTGSISIAMIFDHLPDLAKAIVFPPAPANASMRTVLS